MTLSTGTTIRVIGQREVDAKLLAAAPRILEQNRIMVTQMLQTVRAEVEPQTPTGPGHFGYHGRDTFKVEINNFLGSEAAIAGGTYRTTGRLKAAVQIYWREFGTRSGYRGRRNRLRAYTAALERGSGHGGGEQAGLYATRALAGVRRFLNFYYGKAQWWRL